MVATISRISVTGDASTSSPALLASEGQKLNWAGYDVNCDGSLMLAGPHLIDGSTGKVIQTFVDPNKGSHGVFKSESNSINCRGDVVLLTSEGGLHLYHNTTFVRTINIKSLAHTSTFYPFVSKVSLNCAGDRILVTTPVDTTNHTVLLLNDRGHVLHQYPFYAGPSTVGVSIAMNCAGDRIMVGDPTYNGARGKIDLYNDHGKVLQRIECSTCATGTHFGTSVDLTDQGGVLLVTVRSQDTGNSTSRQLLEAQKESHQDNHVDRHERDLVQWHQPHNAGIRAAAYVFDDQGKLLQTYKYDERQEDEYDVEWRGRIDGNATRVMVSSTFGQQIRTLVYDRKSGHMTYKSKSDMVVEMNSLSTIGIGHGTGPDGIYVYQVSDGTSSGQSSTPSSSNSSSSAAASTGGIIAAIVLMVVAGIALVAWVTSRRKKKAQERFASANIQTAAAMEAAAEEEDDDVKSVELPPVS